MKLASESSYRFERGVDPAGVDAAARRAAELIVDLAGGDIAPGVTRAGPLASAEPPRLMLTLRPQRCRDVLGLDLSEDQQARLLNRLGLRARLTDDGIVCEPPTYRLDLTREIDLVEEVARVHGLDALPVHDELPVRAKPGSDQQQATDAIGDVLVGHGFHEIITFSFVSDEHAQGFVPAPAEAVRLDDERRKAEPLLRPSLLPSLLAVRKQNQDAGNERVAIFELGAAWVRPDGSDVAESRCLSLLLDAAEPDAAVRHVRGTLEELLEQLGGPKAAASLSVHPRVDDDPAGLWWDVADLKLDDQPLGVMGLPSDKTLKRFGLQQQAVLAELDAAVLLSLWPPPKTSQPLPRHPAIERDLSIVVDENVAWAAVEQAVRAVNPALLEAIEYRGVYRGEQVGPGRKSLNFRLRFRDPDQTLRHEQVDSQMQAVVDTLQQQIAAELRT
jgi:phenylalanyl-tRNA synthetase beta chain